MVVVSHDRYFLDRVADRIVEIEDGIATVYEGNYSKYAMLGTEENRAPSSIRQEQRKIKVLSRL